MWGLVGPGAGSGGLGGRFGTWLDLDIVGEIGDRTLDFLGGNLRRKGAFHGAVGGVRMEAEERTFSHVTAKTGALIYGVLEYSWGPSFHEIAVITVS